MDVDTNSGNAGIIANGSPRALEHSLRMPSELWKIVGDHLHDALPLRQLITVCRAFRQIFLPYFYSRRMIKLARGDDAPRNSLSAGLPYTKELLFALYHGHEKEFTNLLDDGRPDTIQLTQDKDDDLVKYISRIIEMAPQLHSLRYEN